MAKNSLHIISNQRHQSHLSEKRARIVKVATISGGALVLSPMLTILSPVWVPAFFVYWIYSYAIGQRPIGADKVDHARKKIVERVEEVKNKVEHLGKERS
ncbi:hypothetical protein QVD17_28188 [Tagetes erecta]|uniref:Oleosin n=1 Tax=Tagetes erecta TaxID=13708 RepID=A0AAD8KA07_TARER|nr:hypothetical protein QVD17_28188 [Tagetes erecta]